MAAREHMSPYSGCVDVLHTHRAVLPGDVLNTLKRQALLNISQNDQVTYKNQEKTFHTLWLSLRSVAKHKLHFVQWKYFSLGPILTVTEETKKVNENLIKRITNVLLSIMKAPLICKMHCMKACAKLINVNAMQTCISRRAGSGTASCLCQTDGRCYSNTLQTWLHILYTSVEPDGHRMSKSFKCYQNWKAIKRKK